MKTFAPPTDVHIRVMRWNRIYHVRWASSGRGARRWPSARREISKAYDTQISPLRAGEVGGSLKGITMLLGSGGKRVSAECLPFLTRETN